MKIFEPIRLPKKLDREDGEWTADGTCCQWCGMYFENIKKPYELFTHGYPVICHDCGTGYTDKQLEELGLQRAIYPTL